MAFLEHFRRDLILDTLTSGNSDKEGQENLSLGGLLTQTGINAAICAGLVVLFCVLRPTNGAVYARRVKHAPPEKKPPRLGINPFAWIMPIIRVSHHDMYHMIGLDGMLLLRFLLGTFLIFLVLTVAGAGFLVPVNYLKGVIDEKAGFDINTFPIRRFNLENMTALQWITAHLVVAYGVSMVLWVVIFLNNRYFIRKRQEYYQSEDYLSSVHSRTLLVTQLPNSLRDDRDLTEYMRELTPSHPVTHAAVGRELGDLPKLVTRHTEYIQKLERTLTSYLRDENSLDKPRPTVKVKDQTVDAINHYTQELEAIEQDIKAQKSSIVNNQATNYGFVVYINAYEAHQALKTIRKSGTGGQRFRIQDAPAPKDIIWSNLALPQAMVRTRKIVFRFLFAVFCCCATIPTSLLSLVTSVSSLRQLFPESQAWFDANQKTASLWQTLVSPLFLAIYFMILPVVFRFIARLQGIHTKTAVERSVMKKMYIYWMFSQVVVFTMTSVLSSLIPLVSKGDITVGQLFESLAPEIIKSLSRTSSFWINYVALRCINNFIELAQVFSLILLFSRRYLTKPTPRQVKMLSRPQEFDIGVVYAHFLFLLIMTLFFAVYAPIILPVGMMTFGCGYVVFKYQLMYVYNTRVQTAGRMWENVVNRIFFAMILFQLFVLLFLRLRIQEFNALSYMNQWVLAIPLPIITLLIAIGHWFWMRSRIRYMNHEISDGRFVDCTKENQYIWDRYLRPLIKEAETTPVVDQKVKHLLPLVYQGRQSVLLEGKGEGGVLGAGNIIPGTNLRYDFQDINSEGASMVGDYSDNSMIYGGGYGGSEYEMNALGHPNPYGGATMAETKHAPHLPGYQDYTGHPGGDPANAMYGSGYYNNGGGSQSTMLTTRQGPYNPYQPSGQLAPNEFPSTGGFQPPNAHQSYTVSQLYDDYYSPVGGDRAPSTLGREHQPSDGHYPPQQQPSQHHHGSAETVWKTQNNNYI
ncbi:hypothetical protein IWQ62_000293 [Dispira parvispora]|uniref:DUF221-domain-containing protein n=1 Tax=Dispira parvispora TaxID=1520584 RepID=A0A9W8E9D9_9FUNG|nr:hypothetical protein IWQ62_000293 [Dispira parvispora]